MKIVEFFLITWGEKARAGALAGAGVFDKPEPLKNGPDLQHCFRERGVLAPSMFIKYKKFK
jgi:hypothetical protein